MKSVIKAKIPEKLERIYQEKDPIKLLLNSDAELRELEKFRNSLQNELDLLNQLKVSPAKN